MAFNTTAEIIDDIRAGKMVVLMDDDLAPTSRYRLKRQKGSPQVSQQRIAPEPSKQRCLRLPSPKTSYNRDMYSQSWHKMAVYYTVPVILKRAVT